MSRELTASSFNYNVLCRFAVHCRFLIFCRFVMCCAFISSHWVAQTRTVAERKNTTFLNILDGNTLRSVIATHFMKNCSNAHNIRVQAKFQIF